MIRIGIFAAFLTLLSFTNVQAQILMPPGGPEHCEPDVFNGVQQSNIDAETRIIEVRADGGFAQSHLSHA